MTNTTAPAAVEGYLAITDLLVNNGVVIMDEHYATALAGSPGGLTLLVAIVKAGYSLESANAQLAEAGSRAARYATDIASALGTGHRVDPSWLAGASRDVTDAAHARQAAVDSLVALTHVAARTLGAC